MPCKPCWTVPHRPVLHRSSAEQFHDALAKHTKDVDVNARRAVDKFLFGKTDQDNIGKGGFVAVEHMPIGKVPSNFAPSVLQFKSDCMSSAVALRNGLTDADIGIVLFCDFGVMGSLKDVSLI